MDQERGPTPTRPASAHRGRSVSSGSTGSTGVRATGGAIALLVVLAAAPALAAPEQPYAWIDQAAGEAKGAFRVQRDGKDVAYTAAGLQRCDKVEWTDKTRPVLVRLSNGRQFLFSKSGGKDEFTVPCDQPGIGAELMKFISSFVGAADEKTVKAAAAMASRDPLAPSNPKPQSLSSPLLDADNPQLIAGSRALYVRWIGGTGPFEVTLADKATGEVLARRSGLISREVTLPTVQLRPGGYRLQIQQPKGPTGHILSEEDLLVVDGERLPRPPTELGELQGEARDLFYADFLATRDEGRWKFEAAQRVADLAARSPAAREWLKYRAGDFGATSAP